MARVTTVNKARKDVGKCSRCYTEIKAGDSYRWAKPGRRGRKVFRCMAVTCRFRPSDLTTSDKLSRTYGAQECAEDDVDSWTGKDGSVDDVKQALDTCAEEVREVAEEYRESAQNIRENISESPTADECDEKAESLDDWAQELEDAAQELEDFEHGSEDAPADGEEESEERAEERQDWVDSVKEAAHEVLGNCPI